MGCRRRRDRVHRRGHFLRRLRTRQARRPWWRLPSRSPHAPRDDDASARPRWPGWWRTFGNTSGRPFVRRVRAPGPAVPGRFRRRPILLRQRRLSGVWLSRSSNSQRAHGVIGGPRRANKPTDPQQMSPALAPSAGLLLFGAHQTRGGDSQQVCYRNVVVTTAAPGSIQGMSETPESSTVPTPVAPVPPPVERVKPPVLYVAAAWVVIVAGIVFILSVVFFAGAIVVGSCHHHHGMMFGPGGPGARGDGPWRFGGPGGPGLAPPAFPGGPGGPAFGPGGPGGPAQSPVTSAPTSAPSPAPAPPAPRP